MDTVVDEILKHGLAAWPLYAAILVLCAVGNAIAAFFSSYFQKRGEALATKQDFDQLTQQLERNTRLTESIKADVAKRSLVTTSELEHRKQQLAQFYGPIYAYLKLGAGLYDIWRGGRISKDQEINRAVLDVFRRQNDEIARIITSKAHLIEGEAMPPVLQNFMTSATLFNLYTASPDAVAGPSSDELPEAKWPDHFESYIFQTTEKLKKDLDRLHREFSIVSETEPS